MSPLKELAEAKLKIESLDLEKEKRAEELYIANQELVFQNEEKEKRAEELAIANVELSFQNREKEKRKEELVNVNQELINEYQEKDKRAEELAVANKELVFQNHEKEKRAGELVLANAELIFQNEEKEKRADELAIANLELAFQNKEKEKRADELVIANVELNYQNEEKEKRADELAVANLELAFQNKEKEKRADELVIANLELAFQNKEKEKRADELVTANQDLKIRNKEREKRTAELILANKKLAVQKIQLEDFCNIVSHNLRGPLINISMLVDHITESKEEEEIEILKEQLKITTSILDEIFNELIESLQVKRDTEIKSKKINLKDFLKKTCDSLRAQINQSKALIEADFDESPLILFPPKYVYSILQNLISNSLKYSSPLRIPHIRIKSKRVGNRIILSVADNGLGIDMKKHKKDLFKIRKIFHAHPDSKGFGLFITKCQIEAMNGRIWAESTPQVGSTFYVEFNNQPL